MNNEKNERLPTVRVHGLDYLDLTPDALCAYLSDLLLQDTPSTIFTPNAKIGADALASAELHALLARADVLLPDGRGVVAASRRQTPDHPLKHRLAGIEAGEQVLSLCEKLELSVFFVGGKTDVASMAAKAQRERHPNLCIAGVQDGYFDQWGEENRTVVERIRQSGAQVVFVCFGFPKQERWIMENKSALPSVRLWMGLGGSFDVWAGRIRRAPCAVRRLGLEWLWRSLAEPRRFRALPAMLRYVYTPCLREK